MKFSHLFSFVAIASLVMWAGCGTKKADDKPADASTGSGEHVHADGTVHKDGDSHDQEEGHTHGEGPHGGTVADWGGGKYHVEFTVDHDKQQATVYILGDDEKTATPVAIQEITLAINDPAFQVTLKASPLDGESDGQSSRFVGTHENLGIVKEYEGSMSGVVDGTPYSGNFKELPHDH